KADPNDPMGKRADRQLAPHQLPGARGAPVNTALKAPFEIVDLNAVPGTPCPCGVSRRGFVQPGNTVASVHRVDISVNARAHYHRHMTEIYYVLDCGPDAKVELNGKLYPVTPGVAVLIRPGTRHRAVGEMQILNVVVPPFDEHDEWFD
ncbi:MAG: cupin domain-containing protein, partial [Planctomycetota bacterium]|nr:cupin domain-containing protein [Planctomycetota bacterium]